LNSIKPKAVYEKNMEETYFITEFLDEFMEKKGSKHFCLMIDDF